MRHSTLPSGATAACSATTNGNDTNLFLPAERMAAGPGYIPNLDGLRALSILLVLFAHYISDRLFPGGLGVYVFFIISGFLITRLLFSERKAHGKINLTSFYGRRSLRLYPVVTVYTLVVIAIYLITRTPIDWLQPLSALFYFANYLYSARMLDPLAPVPMPFGIFWSLSLEEHFYLAFPLLFVLLRGRPQALVFAMIAICVACLGWRLTTALLHPEYLHTNIIFVRTDFRADSISYGVLLAALCETDAGRRFIVALSRPMLWVGALGTILICLAIREPFFRETVRYSLFGVALVLLIACTLFDARLKPIQVLLNHPVLVWLGRLSYSLYVWHYLPRLLGPMLLGVAPLMGVRIAFDLGLALVAALLSYHLVERPILALRRRTIHRNAS
ncbi:acyltransferase [Novosphingobium sp. B-7]|uniref:acyltransferase family protein n=1 Tax=Novosphingobium sp. B-7 TaxID=1298855 RepID=UPI000426E24B|nr:acyltransferase [Novosphingobium sp. B-7]